RGEGQYRAVRGYRIRARDVREAAHKIRITVDSAEVARDEYERFGFLRSVRRPDLKCRSGSLPGSGQQGCAVRVSGRGHDETGRTWCGRQWGERSDFEGIGADQGVCIEELEVGAGIITADRGLAGNQ